MSDACFIVFEGLDGAGTATQAARLATHLRTRVDNPFWRPVSPRT